MALSGIPVLLAALSLAGDAPDFERAVRPVLEQYCLACHGGEKTRGGLDLARFSGEEAALAAPEEWSFVRERLELGEMPPEGRPRPDAAEREALLGWIDARFGPADVAPPPAPVLRRLNHREYRRTVRDLVGVDYETDERFPADEIGHGFDTVGAALSMPELLFERYLEAAEQIAERAVVLAEPESPPRTRFGPDRMEGEGRATERAWVLASHGGAGASYRFPRAGEYALRVAAGAQQAGPELARVALELDGRELARFEVATPSHVPEPHEVRLVVERGVRRVSAHFVNDYYQPEAADPRDRDRNLFVAWVEVEGPLDPLPPTAFQEELFARFGPELGEERLRATLAHLAVRAWRRPLEERELERLVTLSQNEPEHAAAVRLGLQALLSSPHFLYRAEPGVGALSAHQLAARLSYFLWSTLPDAELRALADSGELLREEVLLAQVDRLLADERSFALSEGFAEQWLQIGRLATTSVDRAAFPAFDAELRAAMRAESLRFFDALLREDASVWELLEGEFTFANAALAQLYGLEGIEGDELRRVSLAGLPRRGVLTQASVLTVTSDPTRTSPVKRGKWILETLLGAPPPPPPPGVGVLDESAAAAAEASLRERLEQHRADPACAVCHDTMDPLGFGLENFDGVGAWRESDGAFAVDASGALPDGRAFDGPVELAAMLRRDDGFLRCLVEKLAIYALGRGLERADRATLEGVLARLDPERPTLGDIVRELVQSEAFRARPVPAEDGAGVSR